MDYEHLLSIEKKNYIDKKFRLFECRKVLEGIFKELTRNEKRNFGKLYDRMVFICDKYNILQPALGNIHNIRIFLNKIAHDNDINVKDSDYAFVMGVLSNLIHSFSSLPIPEELKGYTDQQKDAFFIEIKEEKPDIIAFLRAIIIDISDIQKDKNGIEYCLLICENEDIGTFKVFLRNLQLSYDSIGNNYLLLSSILEKYSAINIFNLKKSKDNIYNIIPETIIVFEPDFLIDVTDIAKCFNNRESNPLFFLASKLIPGNTSKAMLQGMIVNDIFDEMIFDIDKDLNDIIKSSVFSSLLLSLSMGLRTIREIMDNIKDIHYKNLKNIIKSFIHKDFDNKIIKLEPTFLSVDYGLQGRLDAMISYKDKYHHTDILELKSGSSPNNGVWENHKIQVICYNMLLKSLYGDKRKGENYVLYSSNKDNPMRLIPSISYFEKDICMMRNLIVSMIFRIANGDYSDIKKINLQDFMDCPEYMRNTISAYNYYYESAGPLELKYYNTFITFLFNELKFSKLGTEDIEICRYNGFSQLWRGDFENKKESYNILNNLEFIGIDNKEISFKMINSIISNFREGDIVILYPQQKDNSFPLDREIIRGTILSIKEDILTLSLRNNLQSLKDFTGSAKWAVEHDYYESGYYTICQSLYDFLKAGKETRELLLGLKEPSYNKNIKEEALSYIGNLSENGRITETQSKILANILKAEDYFLLQGPPGTGKTSIILLHLAIILTNIYDENIAILAFTNRAVNEICEKLSASSIDFIRLGGHYQDQDYLLKNKIKGKRLFEIGQMIKETKIIVSTVSTFTSRKKEIEKIKKLDSCIIDEASQLLEPQLIGNLISFTRFFLIGDQNQLPPISVQDDIDCIIEDELLNNIRIKDLRTSLFERLFYINMQKGHSHCIAMLQDQYRMHESIAELINNNYDNKLISKLSSQKKKDNIFLNNPIDDISRLLSISRTIFMESNIEGNQKTNIEEARRAAVMVNTIKKIYKDKFRMDTVGIITPWRAQANEIKKHLDNDLANLITIDTVERFQGSERDIIIYSLSVSNRSQLDLISRTGIDPRNIDRKLNVAVSRARNHIIIMGNYPLLKGNNHFACIIDKIKTANGYIKYNDANAAFSKYYDTISPELEL